MESRNSEAALKEQHRSVLQDELLSLAAMGSRLTAGFDELVKLHDAGIIPSGSVPVLAERLEIGTCVCGTPLTPGSEARRHLEELIERQKTVDAQAKRPYRAPQRGAGGPSARGDGGLGLGGAIEQPGAGTAVEPKGGGGSRATASDL